ncbi:bifunctional DNA-binding transcriptional regulator/O6-methylguanine-DNA methyltransferase Ada [Pseudomonas daroniae]|uniref:methylated-DNA--[protein]-cysteine S-methyltransferase n=1 Tax=Phytopseudomonas daroniae TaxID=2487519 RepID=A0A4Q9QPF8_9GAMM|nr:MULTISPECIES: bifunctional DNA-binding transcriptional regulator/O6-methylguanine-DNA methyltransferase Ada [Pseudomonas]TBU81230.1 bifunctional DNA-binding transcriptional regulator/O6-methylguanine-DNA methyltransferase Ada [Pseudomonas daroniae]TBU83754.1 bifunctional DNA-binding transcriptional regulator/O6-methylguanine-DNA methyltransferase Ada [Pseudomonas sp. FRB 228]TBU89311.1 bifunctional DNA-binding transcriptional regulator/O6-methylguanine-DNA methyltransferase Ada [Pseudomonas d
MLDQTGCWQAVCDRDATQDGHFVFAVRSTGIYCRPSCPARRPRRENVSFHADSAAAEAAGYRPCKRCTPQGPSPAEQLDTLVTAACRLLDETDKPPTLDRLAARIGLSPSHLARAFKARTGMTPKAWVSARQRERLEQTLPQADSVLDAALASGYSGTRALYEQTDGLSPARRRQGAAGEMLRIAVAPCALGYLLLASSDNGLCALLFGESEAAVETELRQRFPAATLQRNDAVLQDWLHEVLTQIEEPTRAANLPLDLRGTAFQQRVWQALRTIPMGQTRTYGQLAATLGSHPRAIARACASNPLGLLVPCHRVTAADGSLGGYRWGVARKAALLKAEAGTTSLED